MSAFNAEERFFMHTLSKRLEKLEAAAFTAPTRSVRRFLIEGPADLSSEAALAFLRERGHAISDDDTNVIRVVISADRNAPLPLTDLTLHLRQDVTA